jgi:tetratricopeptide (TPR) repeat protein
MNQPRLITRTRSHQARTAAWLTLAFLIPLGFATAQSVPPSGYARAAQLIQEGNPTGAIAVIERLLRQSPQDVRAHNLMGIALSAANRLEEANASFNRAYKLNPKFYPALKNLALNELKLQRVDDARLHLEKFLEASPQDPAANLALAEILTQKGEHAKAVELYIASQGMFLKNPMTILSFAQSCFAAGQGPKAAGALELMPPEADARAHFQAGILLAQLMNYAAAAREFERAREDYPDPYEVGYNLTLAYSRGQNYDAAIKVAEELIAAGYKKAELYNLLADAYEHSRRTVDAYNALRVATQLEPREENNYLDLVALGIDHRNYDLAFDIIEIGLKNIPDSYRLRLAHGTVLALQGQMSKALVDFEEAVRIDPKKDLPFYGMVMALMQTDQTERARKVLKERLAISPDNYLLLYAFGEMQDRIGAPPGTELEKEALADLKRSVEIEPNMAPSRVALGRMLLRRGEVDEAIVHLERAIQLNPDNLSPAYQLATAYRRKGNKEKAAEYQAMFEKYKEEDRDRYMNVQILRLLREGDK